MVGASVRFERAPRLLQHLLGGLGHCEHQTSPRLRFLGQPKLLLLDGDQPLAVPRLGVKRGQLGQRIGLFGIHFEHLLEGTHRLARVGETFATQPTNLQTAGHALLGLRGERELSLGDRHHAWPVLHRLCHPPQRRVRVAVRRIHLIDDSFQCLHRGGKILEVFLEDARAL